MKGLVVLVVCFFVASCIEARNRNIFLRSKTLDTTGTPDYFSSESQQRHVRSSPSPSAKWLIHLKGPITRKIKAEVQSYLGVVLGQYLPQNTFMITASPEVAERAKDAPHVLWVGAYLPEYKVSDLLKTSLAPGQFEENAVRIHLDEIHAAERSLLALQWARVLKSQNIDVTFEIVGRTDMIANTKSIEQTTSWLAEQHETIWLEPVPIFRPTNQWSTRVTQGGAFNVVQQPLLHRYQIFGAGQQIAVGDTNLNRDSCFFKGASVNIDCTFLPDKSCASSPANDHGTHVAGTLVGKPDAPLNVHTGFAPAASLYHIPLPYSADPTNPEGIVITPPRSLFDFFQAASTSGARVVLSSFSSSDAGYTLNDREVDDFVYSNPNLLLVFPAGNNGAKGPGAIGAPASSKNGITVGSSQNQIGALRKGYPNNAAVSDAKYSELFGESILATHSSRGPTTDQRIKPDIVAPGEVIFSASAAGCATQDGAIVGLSGTSMAAAAVAGAATLVRDYLAQSFYGPSGSAGLGSPITTPTAAMIKAILINSGVPLAGVQGSGAIGEFSKFLYFSGTPDGYQGFGRVDLSKVLHLNGTGSKPFFLERNATKSVSTGQTETYCFTAPAGAKVKATLVWSDPPAAVSTSVALVNNLDLILVDRLTGREFRSNGWERYDDINNVEQVEIMNPNPGNTFFAVYVHGTNIPVGGSQRYSLVISGGINIDTNAAACSQGVCPNLCSSRGTCNNGKCQCNQGFFGVDCSLSVCPNNCGSNKDPTVRRGSCNYETHTCICDPRFTGADCSEIKKGLDTIVITTDTGLATPVVAGAICGAVFGGLLLGILVGYFVAVKTLEAQRRKRREQLLRQGK